MNRLELYSILKYGIHTEEFKHLTFVLLVGTSINRAHAIQHSQVMMDSQIIFPTMDNIHHLVLSILNMLITFLFELNHTDM